MPKLLLPLIVILILAGILSYLPVKSAIVYKLGISGDPTTSCCSVPELSSTGEFDNNSNIAFFDGHIIDYPKTSLAQSFLGEDSDSAVLGVTTNNTGQEKWIEVSLSQQKLRAWEGNNIVMEYPISSGLYYPTPKGTYYIWYKTRYQRMTGGKKELGTFYDLPNVPYNMFFYQGYGIHGAYWHNNFGHPMSHGCVNEPLAEAKELFEWAGPTLPDNMGAIKASDDNPGTKVFIH
jgi:prepilin-type processing-associated H-X9-DG protein